MQSTIGFIGSGNMAQSIALGLSQLTQHQLIIYSPTAAEKPWIQQAQIRVAENTEELVKACNIIILATKPHQIQTALEHIKLDSKQCLISVAAGISTDFLIQLLTPKNSHSKNIPSVIRAMPNTPSLIGQGICGLFAETKVKQQYAATVEDIFAAVGSSIWIEDETLMDVVTAVSGSGPAYFYLFVEHMISAAIELGVEKATAEKLAIETFSGAAALLKSTNSNPTSLRQQVTSPGGTTAAAIGAFEHNHLDTIVAEAINAATERGQALLVQSMQNINQKRT